jgi:hypothetical protein
LSVTVSFTISDPGGPEQLLDTVVQIKAALESLLGQGKTASPKLEKAMTGQDLVNLGLVSQAQVNAL